MSEKELHNETVPYLNCKDYLVSNESYEILRNEKKDLLVTSPSPDDLQKYYNSSEYKSHQDKNRNFLDYVYHVVKKISHDKKYRIIDVSFKERSLLDLGAGTGEFLKHCKNRNWKVSGVEPNQTARKQAKEKGIVLKENIDDFKNQKFHVITLWHVLEHVPNLYEYISRLKQLLHQDGKLIIAVPNFKSYDANYYKEYWAAFDVPRHLWHFSQKSIQELFDKENMKVVKKFPMIFDSFYVSLLSEKYKNGKQNYWNAFKVGLQSNLKARKTTEYSSIIYVIKHC